LTLDNERLSLNQFNRFVFQRERHGHVLLSDGVYDRIDGSHRQLLNAIEKKIPLYGVTTGFGDSCMRTLKPDDMNVLQKHLVAYLTCGTGSLLSVEACRATLLARLKSLSRGYSGVRRELIDRMKMYLDNDWIPVIPAEGSLGASGDLVPLAYVAQCLQGEGLVYHEGQQKPIAELLKQNGVEPFHFHAKEGLAIVNGTSTMLGLAAVNIHMANYLLHLSTIASAWAAMAIEGRVEAFGPLVNGQAGQHSGQNEMARQITQLLKDENYQAVRMQDISIKNNELTQPVQDRYSVRCAPQILGPVFETMQTAQRWVEDELNTTSDNPLITPEGDLANGGNFYGGYLAHSMDYLKICLAHMADMADRQLILIMDEKSNRGLPPNLANWPGIVDDEKFLHHGLKGLHQSASAITSEICALAIPNGIFSRSAECHNQDKVSLGTSAANQCTQVIQKAYNLFTLQMICLAQALDLKKIELRGETSLRVYRQIRAHVPFVAGDRPLGPQIYNLSESFKKAAQQRELQ
jgi:histidine ammonia-lyase/phenylalanine ammonia-lyase